MTRRRRLERRLRPYAAGPRIATIGSRLDGYHGGHRIRPTRADTLARLAGVTRRPYDHERGTPHHA